jgi:hypothetical protein
MSNTANPGERGRFSAPRKAATVLRLLRGESLELLSRELGVTAATLAGWRDDFQQELSFLGITSSPSFVREPEGKGYTASCTSFVFSGEALGNRWGSVLLIPCCLSGLFVPMGSYRYSGLSL